MEFGSVGIEGCHRAPWFCTECDDVFPGRELQSVGDAPHFPKCAAAKLPDAD
jgi:hypothetical protein